MHYEIEITEKEAKITVTLPLRKLGSESKKSFGEKEAKKILLKEHENLKLSKAGPSGKFIYNFLTEKQSTGTWTFELEKKKTTPKISMPKTKASRDKHLLSLGKTKKQKKGEKSGV